MSWNEAGSSQPNGLRKHAEAEADVKRVNIKSRKSLFHLKPEKVKFEYCDNLWKQNIFHNPVRKLKACL